MEADIVFIYKSCIMFRSSYLKAEYAVTENDSFRHQSIHGLTKVFISIQE